MSHLGLALRGGAYNFMVMVMLVEFENQSQKKTGSVRLKRTNVRVSVSRPAAAALFILCRRISPSQRVAQKCRATRPPDAGGSGGRGGAPPPVPVAPPPALGRGGGGVACDGVSGDGFLGYDGATGRGWGQSEHSAESPPHRGGDFLHSGHFRQGVALRRVAGSAQAGRVSGSDVVVVVGMYESCELCATVGDCSKFY